MFGAARVRDAILDLPTLDIRSDQIDYSIYATEAHIRPEKESTSRIDISQVHYEAKCKGDEIFWNAIVRLYNDRIKYIPKVEADRFVQLSWSTHIYTSTTGLSHHKIDQCLRRGARDPCFTDAVILSLFFDHKLVAARPWYAAWATTYNTRYMMPERITEMTKYKNLPASPMKISQRPAYLASQSLVPRGHDDNVLASQHNSPKHIGGAGQAEHHRAGQTVLSSFLQLSKSPPQDMPRPAAETFSLQQVGLVQNSDVAPIEDILVRNALREHAAKVESQGVLPQQNDVFLESRARRSSAIRAEERTRDLYENYPVTNKPATPKKRHGTSTPRNKRQCRISPFDPAIVTPASTPEPKSMPVHIERQEQSDQVMKDINEPQEPVSSSVAPEELIKEIEGVMAEEQRILAKAKQLQSKLAAKRTEVASLEAQLADAYSKLADARRRNFH
ncbi:hypothetical protein NLU13_4128 [Sarocladium strictum]|uniref:Uncharacterized protein n=1 Tax=Sarocladium strictum TaxID=5046 RepID=A0AA39GJN8_SARSR|nr:hypothetical protein NLU13_4128 [Sarocladium strictum]